MDVISVWQKCW